MVRVSVLEPSVRLSVESLALIVTAEFAALMQVLLLLVGTPDGVQLPATSQLPVPPFHVAVHCAKAESGHSTSASNATNKTRTTFSFAANFISAKKDRFIVMAPNFMICVA